MLQIKIVLIDMTGSIKVETMATAVEALNVQVTRDLPQFWNVNASVSYRPNPASIPQGMWPILLVKSLPPGEGGYHMTSHNQPYAKVIVTSESDDWTIDASHELVEMLVDPYGNRLQTSNAIDIVGDRITDIIGKCEFLVEACDPCEANKYAYQIDGVMVSDFITPNFYDPEVTSNARYSFTGAIKKPRQVLPGGYMTWVDPKTDEMKQILWLDPSRPPQVHNLGHAPKNLSLREFVEAKTYNRVRESRVAAPKSISNARKKYRASLEAAALVHAKHYV